MPCIPEQNQKAKKKKKKKKKKKSLEYSTWQLDKKWSDNEMILNQNSRFD
jgi:hypothetical protein